MFILSVCQVGWGPAVAAMLEEVFFASAEACLPASLTQGRITLLHKQGKDRTLPDSYRPITLLSVDYKLRAGVVHKLNAWGLP